MKIFRSISILIFILSGCGTHQSVYSTFVLDLKGASAGIARPSETSHAVVLFYSPECPLCISYTPTIMQLKHTYAACTKWTMVFPGDWVNADSVQSFLNMYNVNMDQVLIDSEGILAKTLGAKITPSVFVLDGDGEIEYQGRIDNWMYETGRKRLAPDTLDLEFALKALSEHRSPPKKVTTPVGCLIE